VIKSMEASVINYAKLRELREPVKCCYKISDTDVDCLMRILDAGKPMDADEVSKTMGLSKTTVETSLKRLMELGLVQRKRLDGRKIGRPKFLYFITQDFPMKVRIDLDNCVKRISSITI